MLLSFCIVVRQTVGNQAEELVFTNLPANTILHPMVCSYNTGIRVEFVESYPLHMEGSMTCSIALSPAAGPLLVLNTLASRVALAALQALPSGSSPSSTQARMTVLRSCSPVFDLLDALGHEEWLMGEAHGQHWLSTVAANVGQGHGCVAL